MGRKSNFNSNVMILISNATIGTNFRVNHWLNTKYRFQNSYKVIYIMRKVVTESICVNGRNCSRPFSPKKMQAARDKPQSLNKRADGGVRVLQDFFNTRRSKAVRLFE